MANDRLTVSCEMKPYLKAFLLSCYGNSDPLYLPKSDKFASLLSLLLSPTPDDYKPVPKSPNTVNIIIPYYNYLNISTHNYLTANSQKIFASRVESRFWVQYETCMDAYFLENIKRIDAIVLFIEKYNLPYTSVLEGMLRKAIYRSRRLTKKHHVRNYTKKM